MRSIHVAAAQLGPVARADTLAPVAQRLHRCDLGYCRQYNEVLFDFARYRRPEVTGLITSRDGAQSPFEGART